MRRERPAGPPPARGALTTLLHGRELSAEERAALDFCDFQLSTVHTYMEAPGSRELEEAYRRYVAEPDVNR
jgi:hypothetical protein